MIETVGRGFLAAITERQANGKTYRSATLVCDRTGKTESVEIGDKLNGQVDACLHKHVEYVVALGTFWRDKPEGGRAPRSVMFVSAIQPTEAELSTAA